MPFPFEWPPYYALKRIALYHLFVSEYVMKSKNGKNYVTRVYRGMHCAKHRDPSNLVLYIADVRSCLKYRCSDQQIIGMIPLSKTSFVR